MLAGCCKPTDHCDPGVASARRDFVGPLPQRAQMREATPSFKSELKGRRSRMILAGGV